MNHGVRLYLIRNQFAMIVSWKIGISVSSDSKNSIKEK